MLEEVDAKGLTERTQSNVLHLKINSRDYNGVRI